MIVSIFKLVLFSIIICSFEYSKKVRIILYKRENIYLERNIINFRNNRILTDADNQFDLYDFYQSTSNSHIKKHKENNTLPNLNNADEKTRNLIYKLQKELKETKRKLDNIKNDELSIQPIQDKRVIKID
ncbi:hypothetical protein YYG_04781 [Plasmodium vinckei petteri]|uniref:Fam-b protein n=1 Tax=Plasmodium vinckei petteri TaxID=138298 RepID=W7A9K2_PLAVN|nr:hypothetical protein YYG_04781 [Plasmodium vinckei petteri]